MHVNCCISAAASVSIRSASLATRSKGREIYRDLRSSRQLMKGLGYCVLDDILELEGSGFRVKGG
jgi:hypothetical protein